MIRVDPVEMEQQHVIHVFTEFIGGKVLEEGCPLLHMRKIGPGDVRGGDGIAPFDRSQIVGVEFPVIVIDRDRHVLIPEVRQNLRRSSLRRLGFALAQERKAIVSRAIDPLRQSLVGPAGFVEKFASVRDP